MRRRGLGLLVPNDVNAALRATAAHTAPVVPADIAADLRGMGRTYEAFFKSYNGRSIAEPARKRDQAGVIPAGAESFKPFGVISTPGATGVDSTALTLDVPHGWDGFIKLLSHNYTGGGFVQGSGDLTWRILRDGQAVKNFDAIKVEFGTAADPIDLTEPGIPIYSGQLITYIVNHAVTSGLAVAGTNIICSFAGHLFPR
jgi:hypothetical protein